VSDAGPVDRPAVGPDHSLSDLSPEEKSKLAASFGGVAAQYERFRPGPPAQAVEWILPGRVRRVVDLGAGTGALSRLLVDRAEEVVAVEPDERMRSVLVDALPTVRAVDGRGEAMPLPDRWADAVVASSSWHWMDPVPALHEVARVLAPGGVLGALWSGPDPESPFVEQSRVLLARAALGGSHAWDTDSGGGPGDLTGGGELAQLVLGDGARPRFSLEIPPGVPFDQPEHTAFTWDVPLNSDELIGLLGTFSWIITMPDDRRQRIVDEVRRVLRDVVGLGGDATVDVGFRSDAWRSRRQ
jgi:SAM-dependent methyltransferase